jgi:hypothetical protein
MNSKLNSILKENLFLLYIHRLYRFTLMYCSIKSLQAETRLAKRDVQIVVLLGIYHLYSK